MTNIKNALCWINGGIVPIEQAKISVFDHGLLYGDGVFEGIRLYQGRPFMLDAHLQRLKQSAAGIGLSMPYDADQLSRAIAELATHWPAPSGYIRLLITRGEGSLGIDPSHCPTPNTVILLSKISVIPASKREAGITAITARTQRVACESLDSRIKTLNYLNNILAKQEANQAKVDEAIMLNAKGRFAEASAENIFFVREGELITPPPSEGALDGITKNIILSLAVTLGIQTQTIPFTPIELDSVSECFLTGTGAELIAVSQLDKYAFPGPKGSIFNLLQHAFTRLTQTPDTWAQMEKTIRQ